MECTQAEIQRMVLAMIEVVLRDAHDLRHAPEFNVNSVYRDTSPHQRRYLNDRVCFFTPRLFVDMNPNTRAGSLWGYNNGVPLMLLQWDADGQNPRPQDHESYSSLHRFQEHAIHVKAWLYGDPMDLFDRLRKVERNVGP